MTRFFIWQDMTDADWPCIAAALKEGELVLLPTDTVYGLAGWLLAPGALERIYALKGREERKPVALAFGDLSQVDRFFPGLPAAVQRALIALLPGPVTAVIPAGSQAQSVAGAPAGGAGIRVIPGPLGDIFRKLPAPLALTSANLSGGADPCSIGEVPPSIVQGCGFVIDAGSRKPCLPSTVVDLRPLLEGRPVRILRPGAWDVAKIESLVGAVET